MSTVLYSNCQLIADSAQVVTRYGERVFSLTKSPKLFISDCKSVAIGSSGDIFKSDSYLQELANAIAISINEYGQLTDSDSSFVNLIKRLTAEHKNEMSLIVMTSFDKIIYHIETTFHDNDPIFQIKTVRFEDSYAIGSGAFFALTALNAGLEPIRAVELAIKKDMFSKLPINLIDYKDLLLYKRLNDER